MPDLSIVRRLVVNEIVPFDIQRATGGGSVPLPGGLATIQALVVRSLDQPVTVQLGGTLTLTAGGLLLLFDGSITSAAVTNASGSTTEVQGLEGGA